MEFVDANLLVNFTLNITSHYNYYNRQFAFNYYTHKVVRAGMPLNPIPIKFHFCIQFWILMFSLVSSKEIHYIYSSSPLKGQGSLICPQRYWILLSLFCSVLLLLTMFTVALPWTADSPGQNCSTPLLVFKMFSCL